MVAVAAAALISGLLLRGCLPDGAPTSAATQPSVSAPGQSGQPGPTRLVNGAPAGFAHEVAGARAAATAFVCTGQALIDLDPLAAAGATRQMAATSTADAQARANNEQLTRLRDTLANGTGPITYWQGVLASHTITYGGDRAVIAVWSVGVLSREGVAPPQAAWAVSTLALVWERDDWRLESESIVPGPAPVLNDSAPPATSSAMAAALRDFVQVSP
jgi:hypothetical protein